MATPFSDWLQAELNSRDWSQSDLGRAAGLGRGSVSNLINNVRKPGPEICQSIARALGYPPEIVYRAAGILPPEIKQNELRRRINYMLDKLPEYEVENVGRYIEFLLQQYRDD